MVIYVYFDDFVQEFEAYDRRDNFSYEGLRALYNYLENLEYETGESIELDVISICSDYSEYGDISEINDYYSRDFETLYDVMHYTVAIPVGDTGRIIIQDF